MKKICVQNISLRNQIQMGLLEHLLNTYKSYDLILPSGVHFYSMYTHRQKRPRYFSTSLVSRRFQFQYRTLKNEIKFRDDCMI